MKPSVISRIEGLDNVVYLRVEQALTGQDAQDIVAAAEEAAGRSTDTLVLIVDFSDANRTGSGLSLATMRDAALALPGSVSLRVLINPPALAQALSGVIRRALGGSEIIICNTFEEAIGIAKAHLLHLDEQQI